MTSIPEVQQKLPSTGRFLFNLEDDFGLSQPTKDGMALYCDHVIAVFIRTILQKIHSWFSVKAFSGLSVYTFPFGNKSDYLFDPTIL